MRHKRRGKGRELFYKDGALAIWPLHLAILQGLLDRPRGTAASRWDCLVVAIPYIPRYAHSASLWAMYRAVALMGRRGWVSQKRVGNRVEFSLTPRGRAIVEGDIPARFDGGPHWVPHSRRCVV